MSDAHRVYEIRCPVHGFIKLNDWEKTIISQPAFQRLRRVRQLSWTDYIYPGAMHTRFEHSLGVMHVATMLFDALVERSRDILQEDFAYNDDGLGRDRRLVRLAALLHDLGHGPFSHAAEEMMPLREDGNGKYKHEQYSAAIVRAKFRDAIENHPLNANYGLTADNVAALLEGSAEAQQAVFWRELIDGQMDADRMDYLLRDSHHTGVENGRFDFRRLVTTIQAIPGPEGGAPRIGVSEGGIHSAESLVLARYFMFTQVYFHKTRVAYDIHLRGALKGILPNGVFPPPTEKRIDEYLGWDDWKVLGFLAAGAGGEHGERLGSRNHFREIFHTPEVPSEEDLDEYERLRESLGDLVAAEDSAEKSWYKTGKPDIPVASSAKPGTIQPLSRFSGVVRNMQGNRQRLLFTRPESLKEARKRKAEFFGGG
jgi:hypothetical protein